MAEPVLPPPGKKGGGFLKNLSPKQKRIAMVGGAAALLALIYLIAKSRQPVEGEGVAARSSEQEAKEAFGSPSGGGGGTDPSAALGQQSEQIGARLEEVGGALGGVEAGLGEVGQSQAEIERSQESLEGDIMTSREQAQEESARLAGGLSKNSRQLEQVRKALQGKAKRHGGKGKGRGEGKDKGGRGKGRGKGKGKRPPKKGKGRPPRKQKQPRHKRRR